VEEAAEARRRGRPARRRAGRIGWIAGLWRIAVVAKEDQGRARQIDLAEGGGVGQAVPGIPGLEPGEPGARVEKVEPVVVGEAAFEGGHGAGVAGLAEGVGELGGGHGDTAAGAKEGGGAVEGGVGHGGLRFL
jgi:hypothetical protein